MICEKHKNVKVGQICPICLNVKAGQFCPICLVEERDNLQCCGNCKHIACDEQTGELSCENDHYPFRKEVHALKIKRIEFDIDTDGSAMIFPEEKAYAPFKVNHEYVRKHSPKAGGYYVVYADGYKSWSPADAFESGYTRL